MSEASSKELAAATLTQVYFQSSPTASNILDGRVRAEDHKGNAPSAGGMEMVYSVYKEMLKIISR